MAQRGEQRGGETAATSAAQPDSSSLHDDVEIKAGLMQHARDILSNPELHLDLDNPDASKGTFNVEQMTNLWNWYKTEMHKHVDDYEVYLKEPLSASEKQELESLAKRLGWVQEDQPTGRAHLQPNAYKYKKIKDYDTVKKASKHRTKEEEAEYLARHGAPLDIIPAEEITGTPAAAAAAHEAEHKERQAAIEAVLRQHEEAERFASYSEDSEWWPGWLKVQYQDLPSQPLLQQLITMLQLKKAQNQAAERAASTSTSAAAKDDPYNPVLWRALPAELDPFLLKRPDQGTYKLLAGDGFVEGHTTKQSSRLSDSRTAFVVTVVAVLGFGVCRWVRKRMAQRRRPTADGKVIS